MTTMIKQIFILLLFVVVLVSCNVTFPKETLEQDTKNFIKKEANIDSSVYIYGTTMYLDVVFDDLATNDSSKVAEFYKTIQEVVSSIVRVPLSSDKDIKIVVVSAFDKEYKVLLRIFENIDDIKKYSYHYISRTDYSERQLMEFESEETAKQIVENKYDISLEEYVSRLSVSRVNNSSLVKQILSKLEQNFDLRFYNYVLDTIYFKAKNIQDSKIVILIEKMLENELVKNLQKYKIFSVKSAILLDEENNIVFNINLR